MNFINPNNNLQLNKPYHKILNRHDGIYVDHPVSLMVFFTIWLCKKYYVIICTTYVRLILQYPSLDDHGRLNRTLEHDSVHQVYFIPVMLSHAKSIWIELNSLDNHIFFKSMDIQALCI